MEKVVGVKCASGHIAAVGVTIHFSYVGSPKRPQPEEFEELMQNARKELDKDDFWDALLKDLRQLDSAERKEWLDEKGPASGTSGAKG